jgi:tetratricopeptide (TPR) repeat protein
VTGYTRQDVLRILRIDGRRLRGWERAGLVEASEVYSFQQLGHLRKLRDLRAMEVSAKQIRAAVEAMRSVSGVSNPLLEAGAVRSGSRVAFRHSGATMEPIARQFVFDFGINSRTQQNISIVPSNGNREMQTREVQNREAQNRDAQVSALFFEAVQLEGAGKIAEAQAVYQGILEIDGTHAASCINLGTIRYNQRKFPASEELYRRATEADPGYALAFFDLGNALDELQRLPDAIDAYYTAIRLVPGYADAHYNLALAFERIGQRRKALRHWTAYVKLDNVGPWANHARGQARKILDRERLAIVHRGRRAGIARPAGSVAQLRLAVPSAV